LKTAFSAIPSWLVKPKVGGHLGATKTAYYRQFRVIMGAENTVRSLPKKTSEGQLKALKHMVTVALAMKKWRVDPGASCHKLPHPIPFR